MGDSAVQQFPPILFVGCGHLSSFFIGVQYHPELKSTFEIPAPVFVSFVKAAKEYSEKMQSLKSNPLLQSELI